MSQSPKASSDVRLNPLYQLVLARLLEFIRQPEAIFWVYAFPLIMMVALGTAFRSEAVDQFHVDIVAGPGAEAIATPLREHGRFAVQVVDDAVARKDLRGGKTEVFIIAPQGGSQDKQQYFYDPTRPGSLLARESAHDVLERAAGREDVIAYEDTQITEPGGRYIDFLVPGLIGMGLMGGGLWGVGFAIVDLRIRKLLKRYLATPMKRGHFLAAMMISRLLFTVPECLLLLIFARYMFGVMSHGSYLAVAFLIVLGAFEFAGIGLLVASRVQTLESVSGLMNLAMLPMWIGSGIFYSIERFPERIQPVLEVLPLTPLITAMRAIMQEGATLPSQWLEILICVLWGVIPFTIALRLFRWN